MTAPRRALGFLTSLGGPAPPSPDALTWFPAVGAGLGLALGLVWWAAAELWPPVVATAVVLAADLALTGMLHADGLVDSADGLLPHLDRRARLEVMARPDVGAFGVWAAVAAFALRGGALATLAPAPPLLAGLWCASRTAMAVTVGRVPYARAEGLATAFVPGAVDPRVLVGVPAAVALAVAWRPAPGAVAVAAAFAGAALVVAFARRRLGGFTGDVLGAAGVVAETTGLVVAAARW
jgi:adenosylcobinamide-GDP ribazoletransferase